MARAIITRKALFVFIAALSFASAAAAEDPAEAAFRRGHYLQTYKHDLAGAAAAYKEVVDRAGVPGPLQADARLRLAQCQEDLATADFARLMPPDVIAYAEVSSPGEHLVKLARMMGLVREQPAGTAGAKPEATPLGQGAYFPDDFTLSPALLSALATFRGAAAAVTELDPQGKPDGLLVVHPGDADLLRGMLETAVQFAEPAESIGGFKTYRIHGQVWAVVTTRLFLVSRTRDQVAAAVARLGNPAAASLADQEPIRQLKSDRDGALLFAVIDGPRAAEQVNRHLHGQEGQVARAVLDLNHIRSVSVVVRTTAEGLSLEARLDLMEGHENLLYGLIRTAPCNRQSLQYVPGGAAAVMLLGLNPAGPATADREGSRGIREPLSLMDIGREFFDNLEEIAVFVAPSVAKADASCPPIPDIGLVLVAKDAARSQALWTQLLSLPTTFVPGAAMSGDTDVEGAKGTEYRFPNVPPIALVRAQDRAIVIGTRNAAGAAIRARSDKGSIVGDAGFKPLLDRLTPTSSKAVLVHTGRVAQTAAVLAHGREAEHLRLVGSVLDDVRICLVTDEAPTRFTIRAEVAGLPNVPEAVRKLAQVRQAPHPATAGPAATRPAETEGPQAHAQR